MYYSKKKIQEKEKHMAIKAKMFYTNYIYLFIHLSLILKDKSYNRITEISNKKQSYLKGKVLFVLLHNALLLYRLYIEIAVVRNEYNLFFCYSFCLVGIKLLINSSTENNCYKIRLCGICIII